MTTEEIKQEQPDKTPPSEARQRELETAYEQHKDTENPYKHIKIRTVGELEWVLEQRKWSGEYLLSEGYKRSNLSGANLRNANLSGVTLRNANLSGANFSQANLSGVNFGSANLSGANLLSANLSGADFGFANLSEADLFSANLSDANLVFANLSGANLSQSNLSGADLVSANLSGADMRVVTFKDNSELFNIIIDVKTRFGDIKWNGVPLLRVDWTPVLHRQQMLLGDEQTIDEPVTEKDTKRSPNRKERRERIAVVNRAYIGLARELKDQNLTDIASAARLRSKRLNRRLMLLKRPFGFIRGFGSGLLDLVSGYGEIPERTFISYLFVVSLFSSIYWYITNFFTNTGTPALKWYESIVLSLSSFHGRGFFTNTINLGDPLAIVAAFEAVLGLFIELILIATFSRRFLGD